MAAMQAISLRAACCAGSVKGAMLRSVRYTPATTSAWDTSHTVMAWGSGHPQRVGGWAASGCTGRASEGVMELGGGQAEALGRQQGGAATVDAQLRKDGRHVHTHGVFAQAQVACDDLVGLERRHR